MSIGGNEQNKPPKQPGSKQVGRAASSLTFRPNEVTCQAKRGGASWAVWTGKRMECNKKTELSPSFSPARGLTGEKGLHPWANYLRFKTQDGRRRPLPRGGMRRGQAAWVLRSGLSLVLPSPTEHPWANDVPPLPLVQFPHLQDGAGRWLLSPGTAEGTHTRSLHVCLALD